MKSLDIEKFTTVYEIRFCFCEFFHSFVLKTRVGRTEVYRDRLSDRIFLREGEYTQVTTRSATPPESVTVRIEVVEPNYR